MENSGNNMDTDRFNVTLNLTGQRFTVIYLLTGSEEEARGKAEDICVEQTIEFPADLVTAGDIRQHLLGRIESFQQAGPETWGAGISFAIETAGPELTQLLYVIFGNFSMKTGVRVERLQLPEGLLEQFRGPRFGIRGLRERLGIFGRPLFCTALKPMGLSSDDHAQLAYLFAKGGVDLIKDDHGLADQPFSPFFERVEKCAAAVARANSETGGSCLYLPNLTASVDRIVEKAVFAKECGAGAVMVAPGLLGFDVMRMLADDDSVGLPVMAHPALMGSHVVSPGNGFSHYAFFGQLTRLAGADAVIYPNYGGRFPFSRDDCRSIVQGTTDPMGHIKPVFSAPGGGMNLERIPEIIETFGKDMIFLIGGALHKMGADIVGNCGRFMDAVLKED